MNRGSVSRVLARTWVASGKRRADHSGSIRAKAAELDPSGIYGPFASLVRELAPDRSFADMGCMWRLDGAVAFLAEECGAVGVTAFDASPRTPKFDEEHARRGSRVRFVRGDLHRLRSEEPLVDDPDIVGTGLDEVGPHDVVWCTGVLYHTPNPFLILGNLLAITRKTLVVGSKTIPEVPGLPQAAVFIPGLNRKQREIYAPLFAGVTAEYDRTPLMEYANWWWGLTPSALRGYVDAAPGFRVRETIELPYHGADDNCLLVVEADGSIPDR